MSKISRYQYRHNPVDPQGARFILLPFKIDSVYDNKNTLLLRQAFFPTKKLFKTSPDTLDIPTSRRKLQTG